MTRRRLSVPLLLLAVTCGPAGMAAGQVGALQQRLARATALDCSFSSLATGTWTDNTPGADVSTSTLAVAFTEVNAEDGTAEATGQFGGVPVVVRYVSDYLHLMQMHSSGPLHVTTVLARGTRDGRLMAVHTRHEYTDVRLPGFTSRPEMYLGDCALSE
jgi:hypothetical protein